MNGPGDVGGEVSGEEAAWRDLVAHYDTPAEVTEEAAPWPDRENLAEPGRPQASPAGPASRSDTAGSGIPAGQGPAGSGTADPAAETGPAAAPAPGDRTRIIRFAGDPRNYSPAEEPEDEKYVPVPLPPPAKLDPLAKAAWAGLIGGPAYLLICVLVGWTISGFAAFIAIAAFIAGFVVLVLRLGDGSKRDDDDDGAVV
jgi:hypothetical protein